MKKLLLLSAMILMYSVTFSQIIITSTVTNVSCFGGSNGSATISATGGTAPYTYTLSSAPFLTNSTGVFTGLVIGNYALIVEDAAANTSSITITITEPNLLHPTATVTNVACFGMSTGIVNTTGNGGIPPYLYSIAGGAYQSSSIFANQPAGVQIINVKDANNCIGTNSVVVTQATQVNIAVLAQNANCMPVNGIVSTTVTGGTPMYTYTWFPNGGASATSTTLTSGNYTFTATDALGCSSSNSFTIGSNLAPTIAISAITNVSCYGSANGDVNMSVTGGTGAYAHLWSNGITVSHATNLFAGVYTYTVTDTNGCSSSQSVTISQPPPMSMSVTHTNVSCFSDCSGQVQISNVTGGVAPYTYHTMSSSPQTNPLLTGLCAGTYTVYTKDANNCEYAMMAIITQPTQIIASTTSSIANCGQSNGAICLNVTGGSGVYNTIWSNGPTTFCNTNIPGGAYTYTVIDLNGCSVVATKIINSTGGPSVSITSQTNVSCFGLSNGSASASATGGSTPYTYTWTQTSTNSPTLSLVSSGIYNVIVADATGCVGTQSVVITQPSQLLVYTNSTPECSGTCNGSINASINGGTAPYQYTWSTGATTTNYLPGLCAGMYSVQVTDMMGCVATQTAVVNTGTVVPINFSITNASCGGICDGMAIPSTLGWSGIISYNWSPSGQTSSIASNLCAGNYTLFATDMNGCISTTSFSISNIGATTMANATLSTVPTKETCLYSGDGSIDLTITGSNPGPFTYHWSNGATTQDAFNLNTNYYTVTVFDAALNCLRMQDTITADGTNCGIIKGNVFIDNNADCFKNSGDLNCNSALIVVNPGNRYGYVNTVGDYAVNNLPLGSYSVSLLYGGSALIPTPTCSTTINTSVSSGSLISNNNNFSVDYNSITQPDMQVWGYSSNIVPGFIAHITYQLTNLNNVSGTGLFKVVLPSLFTSNITMVSPNTYTLSGDTVIWNFNNITFVGGGTYFGIDFYVPVGTTLGSLFSTCMYAQPNITDLNYGNNTYCYSTTITGSFDPNDKTVSPVGVGPNGDIAATETDLTYLIRFQNTGNGPAVNIVVKDTLSPNVDMTTFEMLSASHNYNIDILPGNVLRWKFNNIMLADSGSNEPASHGYIQYRIKRTNNNTPGTQIKNTAYIYFDFNEPVVTNTAINTIETITGIKSSFNTNDEWNVYPNPSTGVLYIVNSSSVKEESQIQVVNSIGQTVLEETITSNYKNIDLSKLNNGVYFIKIISDKQSVIKRVALSR